MIITNRLTILKTTTLKKMKISIYPKNKPHLMRLTALFMDFLNSLQRISTLNLTLYSLVTTTTTTTTIQLLIALLYLLILQ